jgi:hypothetical protein
MLASADQGDRTVADRAKHGAHAAVTIVRYCIAWPIFIARETLAAYDDGLAFMMNIVLGDDWKAVGFDEARRHRRRAG